MVNPYFTDSGQPAANTRGDSSQMRTQFAAIEDAFDAVEHTLMVTIDLNTAASYFLPVPWAADIVKFATAIDGALTGADAGLTLEIGGILVTGSALTITQSGSAAGDFNVAPPSAALSVAAGGTIEVICDGAPSAAVNAQVLVTVKRTA